MLDGKWTAFRRAARGDAEKQICRGQQEFDAGDFIQVLVDIPDLGRASVRQTSGVQQGAADKGQRTASERVLDKERINIDDPVAEAFIRARRTITRLVRMQDVTLPRQGVPLLASKAKALNARERDADRTGVVPMRGKSPTLEMGLQTFDPQGA